MTVGYTTDTAGVTGILGNLRVTNGTVNIINLQLQ